MESPTHSLLKRAAIAWMRSQGYHASSCEVRSPIAKWVFDAAGWRDSMHDAATQRRVRLDGAQTVVIECKRSRADFLRDSRRLDALLSLRDRLDAIRRSIEEHRIKALEPQLRRSGTSLFAELEEWDFASSRQPAYRRTLRRLEQIDQRLHGQTKFFRVARYALADALFIAAPRGMIRRRELPPGWGLLELCDSDSNSDLVGEAQPSSNATARLTVCVEPQPLISRAAHRQRLLRNIAMAACGKCGY